MGDLQCKTEAVVWLKRGDVVMAEGGPGICLTELKLGWLAGSVAAWVTPGRAILIVTAATWSFISCLREQFGVPMTCYVLDCKGHNLISEQTGSEGMSRAECPSREGTREEARLCRSPKA